MMTMKNISNLFSREQAVNKTSEDDLTGGEKRLEQRRLLYRERHHVTLYCYYVNICSDKNHY